jgi:hypothetical protein
MLEISPKAKRWWTKELTALCCNANKLGRKASKLENLPDHQIHVEYEKAKKQYASKIEKCKRQHWHNWLEKAVDLDI